MDGRDRRQSRRGRGRARGSLDGPAPRARAAGPRDGPARHVGPAPPRRRRGDVPARQPAPVRRARSQPRRLRLQPDHDAGGRRPVAQKPPHERRRHARRGPQPQLRLRVGPRRHRLVAERGVPDVPRHRRLLRTRDGRHSRLRQHPPHPDRPQLPRLRQPVHLSVGLRGGPLHARLGAVHGPGARDDGRQQLPRRDGQPDRELRGQRQLGRLALRRHGPAPGGLLVHA